MVLKLYFNALALCLLIFGAEAFVFEHWRSVQGKMTRIIPQPPKNWGPPTAPKYGMPPMPPSSSPKEVMQSLTAKYRANTLASLPSTGSCTASNIVVRREWGNLSATQRREFISALRCLARLPSKTSPSIAPGARSRYDDFIVGHALRTVEIHNSGYLLPWHREMVWQIEQALRNECGYTGYQPYWDWSKWADTPDSANPIFDGSDTSMSGNGKYVAHGTLNYTTPAGDPPVRIIRAPGTGGGCIAEGPFVNWTTNLGPSIGGIMGQAGGPNPQANGLGYNPRCVIRDFLPAAIQRLNSYQNVTELILNSTTIHEFHPSVETGIHAGGHGFIGGLNADLFVSCGDPLFYFHHAMLDRVWSIWQSLDFDTRVYKDALDGTRTMLNSPPSGNVTLDDIIYISPVFKNVTVREVMSTTNGRYCYIYD